MSTFVSNIHVIYYDYFINFIIAINRSWYNGSCRSSVTSLKLFASSEIVHALVVVC